MRLRRKPFAILKYFAQHSGRLITHDEIVEAVWGKVAVSESLVRTHVRDLRHVLGEKVIETVVGRGYRFLADIADIAAHAPPSDPAHESAARADALVGRDIELCALESALRNARARRRSVVLVTGGPGVGKTALVDAFVERACAAASAWIARGACIEQYGSGEAYLPVLDALGSLCRSPRGKRVVEVLMRHAPSWLAQMPSLVPSERLDELHRRGAGGGPSRMLREIAEALDTLGADAPVVLSLDDLQWSDPSTLYLVALLGRRREPAQVLVVGTYRPSEIAPSSRLPRIADELVAHRQAMSIRLEAFDEASLEAYLEKRFAGHGFPPEFARTIHRMTGGNPLFVVTLLEDLSSRGMVGETDGGWTLLAEISHVSAQRPDGIRRLLDTQIDRLGTMEQRILEAASVAGLTFTAGVVAHALDAGIDDVDSTCETLANERRFLQYVGTETWPDGTIYARYAFAHTLFQHAALARNPSASARLWHRKIAERLEAGYAGREEEVAGELALHFDEGQRPAQAARYYTKAGERAARRFGNVEAVSHFQRALALIATMAPGPEHPLLEFHASFGLGQCLFLLHGAGAVPALQLARDVAVQLQDDRLLVEVLLALQSCQLASGHYREVAEQAPMVARVVERVGDPAMRARATQVEASVAVHRGRLDEARRLYESLGVFRADDARYRVEEATQLLPRCTNGAVVLLLTGRPEQALALLRRAYEVADALGDPFWRAALLCEWGKFHAWRREPTLASELATRSLMLAEQGSFDLLKDRARTVVLWARAHLEPEASEREIDAWVERPWAAGDGGRSLVAALFAAACSHVGREERALEVIATTLERVERNDERITLPELYRLRGEVLWARDKVEATRSIEAAIDIAREQSSILLELRASSSLYGHSEGATKKRAREELARLVALFTEGLDLPDLVEARATLG